MTHITEKPLATMPMGPMLVRADLSRLTGNPIVFAGATMLRAFALHPCCVDITGMDTPRRARAAEGNR